jgi:CubicO group peptidase (beta-lactamase class C family)
MKQTLLLAFFISLLTGVAQAQSELSPKLEALVQEASAKNVFSGNVLIHLNGKLLYERSIGMADYENKIPNAPETRFSIGSITKLFTRILVLQLASEGKIKLDDKLGKYLSGFQPDIAEKVSLAHLLNHQSGFLQYYEVPGFDPEQRPVNSATDFLPWLQEERLAFEPGAQAEYSNSGYVLLAAIIEKVTGENYADLLKARIFDKIGMGNSGFLYKMKNLPGKAVGYLSNQPGPLTDNLEFGMLGGGDGGIYCTANDLLLCANSLVHDNRLLSDDDKLRLVNEPVFPKQHKSWEAFKKEGQMAIAGGGPGISAVLGINMAKNRVSIVLSNYDDRTAESVFQRVIAILNGQNPEPLQPSLGIFLYNVLTEKGADYFNNNIEKELQSQGYDLEDDNDMPLFFAGQALLQEGKVEESIALYQYYTKRFPQIVVAWNDLGEAYLLKNDKVNARKCFQKALELRPGNPRATENLEKL